VEQAATYVERVQRLLGDWALLTGESEAISEDPRMRMVSRNLQYYDDSRSAAKSALCADGSPLEFCERISRRPQAVAFTLEPLRPATNQSWSLASLCRLLQTIAPVEEVQLLGQRLSRYARSIRSLWLGADFAQSTGVRIYCHLTSEASIESAFCVAGLAPSSPVRQTIFDIFNSTRLRVVGLNFGGLAKGIKLAFSHPLDSEGMERIAGRWRVPGGLLRDYMSVVSRARGGWRKGRCGVGVALDEAGAVQGLTIYHYAAPYFLNDQELRSFVLRLADRFSWDTTVYRSASRLLDREGVRVRTLIGFTVSVTGERSLRLYGQSGALA
jgi:hypothetical protein